MNVSSFFDELEKISKHIFITGVPASGKTTEAHRLERRTGMPVIHGDDLPSGRLKRPGTEALRRVLKKLKTPHIVEGVQVMGLRPKEVAGHDVRVLEPSRRAVIRRMMRRGNPDEDTIRHKRRAARGLYWGMSQNLSDFKGRFQK